MKNDRRSGADRRNRTDRRTTNGAVGNERRAGADRRSGVERRRYRGIDPYARLQLALVLGGLLSIPAVRTWSDGGLAIDAAAIRVAVGMVFALLAINGLNALLVMYAPKPSPPDRRNAVEDAVIVDGTQSADGEAAT